MKNIQCCIARISARMGSELKQHTSSGLKFFSLGFKVTEYNRNLVMVREFNDQNVVSKNNRDNYNHGLILPLLIITDIKS